MLRSRHPCQLRNLSLGCMHDKVTDDVVLEIARKSPQIQQLDLTYCEKLTQEGMISIFKLLPGLQQLSLRRCSKNLTEAVVTRMAELCPRLLVLDLSFCLGVSDVGVMRVAGLRELDLYKCTGITDYSLLRVADCCADLRALSIGYCANITSYSLVRVVACCPLLETLDLTCTSMDFDSVSRVLEECHPAFSSLTLQSCRSISVADCDKIRLMHPRIGVTHGVGVIRRTKGTGGTAK